MGAIPARRASLAELVKHWMPAISAMSLAAVRAPTPGSSSRLGCCVMASRRSSSCRARASRVSSRSRLTVLAHHADVGLLLAAGEAASKLLKPGHAVKASGRQRELRPAVVQQPPQPVLDPRALPDQALAMVEEELDLPGGAVQHRDWQRLDAPSSPARATASASIGSLLPAWRSPRRRPAIRCGEQSSIAHTRSPVIARAGSASAHARRSSPSPSRCCAARRFRHRPPRTSSRACEGPTRSRSSTASLPGELAVKGGPSMDTGQSRALPRSHQVMPRILGWWRATEHTLARPRADTQ
jgi:hypothetical protein